MSITNKTLPPTPTVTTTSPDVPLGINLDLTQGINSNSLYSFQESWLDNAIYYGSFSVNKSDDRNKSYYTIPFRAIMRTFTPSTSRPIAFVPWSLLTAYFSSSVKVDWEITLQPVKVSDARCGLDIVTDFNNRTLSRNNSLLYQPTITYTMDSPLSPLSFIMPTFWVTESLPTPVPRLKYQKPPVPPSTTPTFILKRLFSPFTPNTVVRIFNALPYRGNDLFPDSFIVVVWVRPIVKQAVGIRAMAKSYTPAFSPVEAYNDFPTPYFTNTIT